MKKEFLIILGVGAMLNFSCQKSLLSPVSETQVSDQDYQPFTTAARINSQVLGLYASIRQSTTSNATTYNSIYGGRYQIYNDIKADNWLNYTSNSVTAYQTWNETVTSTASEVEGLWQAVYRTINSCNLFIDGMAAKGTAVVGSTQGGNYVAEAKFLRALSYYSLLQLYCRPYWDGNGNQPGLPLRLTGNSSYNNYDLARSTVAQVYTQIISDLQAAETGLPTTYADASTNTTRAHKNTAIALLTRVYLTMQKWPDVITEANKVVPGSAPFTASSGVANTLQATPAAAFTTYTTPESIFSMPFVNATETPGSQSALADYFGGLGATEFYLNPNGVIADPNWKASDLRRGFVTTKSGRGCITKFSTAAPYTDWAPVIRWPEVLLNLAEARARSTQSVDAQAVALLNAVRHRADASTTYTTASFATYTDLVNAILQERNIEFLGEGLRNIDLVRLGLTIPAKGTVPAITPTDPRYIWPIPNSELLYNKLMTSNP